MHFLLLVFALMLAMSTLDTLVNGIASSLATDMAGMGVSRGALMLQARAVTAVIAVPAIIVASQGFSVLYVFLIAVLLGAAIAAPMLVGLDSGRMTGWAVLLVSTAITAVVVLVRKVSAAGDEYDFRRLQSEVRLIDGSTAADD